MLGFSLGSFCFEAPGHPQPRPYVPNASPLRAPKTPFDLPMVLIAGQHGYASSGLGLRTRAR
jgi:hypothetical protein